MINVIFVEQQGLFRAAIQYLLARHPTIKLVASLETGKELLGLLGNQQNLIILLSTNIEDVSLVSLIKKLKRDSARAKILVLANDINVIIARQYMLAGADGYLVKTVSEEEFIDALTKISQNKTVLPEILAQKLANQEFNQQNKSPFVGLSEREMDILLLMVKGKNIKAISEILHLSPKTISTYKGRIFEKMNVKSMMDVYFLAGEFGLIKTESPA